jgi:hypothetical protein
MKFTKHSIRQLLRATITLASLSVLVTACSSEAPPEETSADAATVLSMAVDAVGGSEALANLSGTSHDSKRYSYIMGQGPFSARVRPANNPATGIFRFMGLSRFV